jgi:hypothetical protein
MTMTLETYLPPGTPAKLLEGYGLHGCTVTGQQIGFVSIRIGGATRLVRRNTIYVLPQERRRLQEDIQNSINQLANLHDEVARANDPDPTEWVELDRDEDFDNG